MTKTTVKELFRNAGAYANNEVNLAGWVKNHRDSKTFGFIELNDGSFFKNVVVLNVTKTCFDHCQSAVYF